MTCAISVGTAIALGSLAVGAGGLGYGIYSGEKQQGAQDAALKKQNTAEQTATAAALSTERNSEIAQGAANQKTPDIVSILRRAAAGGAGASSTMLTGPSGVNPSALTLGKTTLLGA